MTTLIGDLRQQVATFADHMANLLHATLPDMPDPTVETEHRSDSDLYVISTGENARGVPLFVGTQRIATLMASASCRLDSVNRYLAVDESRYSVRADVDRTPILRYEYRRGMDTAPNAHLHVHAHRGALSHLLSSSGHKTPHDMSALHIPLGGSRFRPCLEDLIQFLIEECRFDSKSGWRAHVESGRERWRRGQVAAVTRDVPDEAARVLKELGYQVLPPPELPSISSKALRHW
jgi:hypothetical protein